MFRQRTVSPACTEQVLLDGRYSLYCLDRILSQFGILKRFETVSRSVQLIPRTSTLSAVYVVLEIKYN
jgi:hypothetical protein